MRPPQGPLAASAAERPGAPPGPWPLEVAPDPEALALLAGRRVVAELRAAQRRRGRAAIALAGGGTPRRLYRLLGTLRHGGLNGLQAERPLVDWRHVEFFWTDERCVPPDDRHSNYRLALETLLDPLGVPEYRVHRIAGELPPEAAARRYAAELDRVLGGAPPRFDLVLLGLGADGHTASLFPGDPALDERRRTVVPAQAPRPPRDRITLTLPVLTAARRALFLVSGSGKSEAVRRVLVEREALPATLLRAGAARIRWLLDRSAASRLPGLLGAD